MSKRLSELSAKASSGTWAPGHLSDPDTTCNCRSVVTDHMLGCVFKALDPMQIEERFRSEYPTDEESAANMLFVCELVNAFREGRLVEVERVTSQQSLPSDEEAQSADTGSQQERGQPDTQIDIEDIIAEAKVMP